MAGKHGYFWVSLLLFLVACRSQKPVAEECPLVVRYEAYGINIFVSEGRLTYVDIEYEFPAPQVATPSRMIPHTLKEQEKLSSQQLRELEQIIEESGFMDLGKEAYGAPEGVRYYGYSLQVSAGCRQKSVLYRSNPEYDEPMPKAFVQVVEQLKALAGAD